MQAALQSERDKERVREIHTILEIVFYRIVYPVLVLWVVFDFIFGRELWTTLLLVRLTLVPIGTICIYLSKRMRSSKHLQILCLITLMAIGLETDTVIWLTKNPVIYNYVGLIFITMGASCFIPFTRFFWFCGIVGTYLPFLLGSFFLGERDVFFSVTLANLFYISSAAIIAFFIAEYNESLRSAELEARVSLSNEVKTRDQIILTKTKEAVEAELMAREARVIADIAKHVSHDIRSPISAMNLVVGSTKELPEPKRKLLSEAINRVNDIANDLLKRSKASNILSHEVKMSITELRLLVDEVLLEKRVQYQDEDYDISLISEAQKGTSTVRIDPSKFKRIISNLINNSIESFSGEGKVDIELSQSPTDIIVHINDNGCGISADILPKVMVEGFTHGKPGGNGLGLSTARREIESWGGTLTLASAVGVGTKVMIRLPISKSS